MIDTDTQMTRIRINFLLAFEGKNGRMPEVTRLQLNEFVAEWESNGNPKGPLNLPIKFPSWLTNPKPNPYKTTRGRYSLPWSDVDKYQATKATTNAPETVAATPTAPDSTS